MRSRSKAGLLLLLLVFAVALAAGCGETGPAEEQDTAVAMVNGEEIGRGEFEFYMQQVKSMYEMQGVDLESDEMQEMREGVEQQVLEELINRALLLQRAEDQGFSADEEEVQEEYEYLQEHFGGEEMLLEELEAMGMSPESLRKDLHQQLTIQEYVDYYLEEELEEGELDVSPEEVEELYDQYSEHQDMPAFEEIELHLKEELEQQKMGKVMDQLSQQLREDSEIEVYL